MLGSSARMIASCHAGFCHWRFSYWVHSLRPLLSAGCH